MKSFMGKSSIALKNPVEIVASASIVGTKEGQGPLGALFDRVGKDDEFGAKTWEEAECTLQREALLEAMRKAEIGPEDIRYLFAGDLLGQSIASSFGLNTFQIPMFGLYGACSTCGEALILGTMVIAGGFAEQVACVTSSHFASAEKEFRFPLEYGNQRPLSASWTVTGSGAFILRRSSRNCEEGKSSAREEFGKERRDGQGEVREELGKERRDSYGEMREELGKERTSNRGGGGRVRAGICGMTVGKIVDFGLKDSMNMGACMAPAAADTLLTHFQDWGRGPEDYDHIITGDLGRVGQAALLDILRGKGMDLSEKHLDCGMLIYDADSQDVHAGGSGCGCCAATLSAYVLKQLEEGFWKRVLFLPTGALLSKTSFNEGKTVPGICHAVVLESPDGQ